MLFSLTALSGCSSDDTSISDDVRGALEGSVKTPNLSLVTPSPSNVKTLVFEISNLKKNSVVSIYSDSGCTQEIEIDSASTITIAFGAIRLFPLNEIASDGDYSFYAKQKINGVSSACSSAVSYTLDTMVLKPTLALAEGTVSPSNNPTPSFFISGIEK